MLYDTYLNSSVFQEIFAEYYLLRRYVAENSGLQIDEFSSLAELYYNLVSEVNIYIKRCIKILNRHFGSHRKYTV